MGNTWGRVHPPTISPLITNNKNPPTPTAIIAKIIMVEWSIDNFVGLLIVMDFGWPIYDFIAFWEGRVSI
jgi:hypothetical protein